MAEKVQATDYPITCPNCKTDQTIRVLQTSDVSQKKTTFEYESRVVNIVYMSTPGTVCENVDCKQSIEFEMTLAIKAKKRRKVEVVG